MGDFLLDFREPGVRRQSTARAESQLAFCADTQVKRLERDSFTLVLTRVDGFDLWGPCERRFPNGSLLVALAGRIALDEPQWDAARQLEGEGGLACKAICERYRAGGTAALEQLNGNFVVFVHDEAQGRFHLVTDRCGMYLAYGKDPVEQSSVFGSHPDVLASALGEEGRWDLTSMAEFLMTGRLTYPWTYHQNIRGLDTGCVYTRELRPGAVAASRRQYFQFDFHVDPGARESDLAEQLGDAFGRSVKRRTLPLFGTTGIGLSGGLDSRAILSATNGRNHVRTFNLFDRENVELRTAARLAAACGVELIRVQRDFEYYGSSAELGVRISGGTGCFASNHFLGIRDRLPAWGIQNVLTGCYCDYLLKGLALNKHERRFTRIEQIGDFQFEFYRPNFWLDTPYRSEVQDRLRGLFPESAQKRLSEADWLQVERKRTFPLAYEGDLAQRTIPQRVMPWYLPIVDNDVLEVYLRIPSRFKLKSSLFRKMVLHLCNEAVCRVPDSNSGAPLNASWLSYCLHRYQAAARNRLSRGMATPGSWPNWEYYIRHSSILRSLWSRKNDAAADLLARILGAGVLRDGPESWHGRDVELFLRILTLKIWLDQQLGLSASPGDGASRR